MTDFVLNGRGYSVDRPGGSLSEADIGAFEASIGKRFPSQLRDFYLKWNGGLPYPDDVNDDSSVCVRLKWNQNARSVSFGPIATLHPLFRINNANQNIDFFSIWRDFKGRIPGDTLCFANDPGGSLFLIGTDEHNLGKVYFWERSFEANIGTGEQPSYANIADIAETFVEFLLLLREEPMKDESLEGYIKRVWSDPSSPNAS